MFSWKNPFEEHFLQQEDGFLLSDIMLLVAHSDIFSKADFMYDWKKEKLFVENWKILLS